MSAGKPVVATMVGGAAEAVIDGDTGFLVASNDDQAMAERILELLQDSEKAKRFGERGRRIVEEKFSLAAQLGKTLELYEGSSK
jgi:glycosyltransferase involved in cell wall biosynthesis